MVLYSTLRRFKSIYLYLSNNKDAKFQTLFFSSSPFQFCLFGTLTRAAHSLTSKISSRPTHWHSRGPLAHVQIHQLASGPLRTSSRPATTSPCLKTPIRVKRQKTKLQEESNPHLQQWIGNVRLTTTPHNKCDKKITLFLYLMSG
jgi:hypothetical protein